MNTCDLVRLRLTSLEDGIALHAVCQVLHPSSSDVLGAWTAPCAFLPVRSALGYGGLSPLTPIFTLAHADAINHNPKRQILAFASHRQILAM